MKIQPLHDRILVKRLDADTMTAGGLYIPEAVKEKPVQAIVVAVGEGRWQDGKFIEPRVKSGDKVLFSKYGGTEINVDGEDHLIMREDDLLAVITD